MDDRKANVRRTFLRRVGFRSFYLLSLTVAAFFVLAWFLTPGVVNSGKVEASVPTPDAAVTRANFDSALNFRTAHDYAVFSRRGVSDDGNTRINGDVGSLSRNAFDGLLGGNVRGHMIDPVNTNGRDLRAADRDLGRAYTAIRQLPCSSTLDSGQLGDRTFSPGVYCLSDGNIDGQMTLDAAGDANAVFVFRINGTLGTHNGARVSLTNGADAGNVYLVTDNMAAIAPNSDIDANIIAKRDVTIGEGSEISGKTYSVDGRIETANSALGGGTGRIEICKTIRAGSAPLPVSSFTFTVGATTVSVPVGSCSGPIEVASGNNVVVTEATVTNTAVSAITTNLNNTLLVNANLPLRQATVIVREGDVNNETVVTFENTTTQTGVLEICKLASDPGGADVTGPFNFQINALPGQTFSVSVGQCSGPITVTTNMNVGEPFNVIVTELGRLGFQLERITTIPADRLVSTVIGTPTGGGSATVRLIAGIADQQVVVNFFNRANAAALKICKIAGPGVPEGAIFRFNIVGTAPNPTPPTFPPGVPVNTTLDVPAGPAPFGTCRFTTQTFVVGTPITVTELAGTFGGPAVASGDLRVARIRYFGLGTATTNLANRTATFTARPEQVVVEFTNFVFNPAVLKVCKTVAAGSPLIGQSFTFDLSIVDPNGLFVNFPIAPVTVTAGTGTGNCVFAAGQFGTTNTDPPLGVFNLNSQIVVTERLTTGVSVTNVASPTGGTLTNVNLTNRTATIQLNRAFNPNTLFNEITFTNAPTVAPGPAAQAVRFDFDGDGKADPSIFTPNSFTWRYLASGSGGALRAVTFGEATDRPVPADYDGDGKFDQAVYRNGTWYILGSTNIYEVHNWGEAGDIPVVADYDGDGKADRAIFRPSTGTWWIVMSRDGWNVFNYGVATDRVIAADFDGDGKADPAVFRNGQWFIRGTQMGFAVFNFGVAGDIPTVADFDGDHKADIAVYRSGTWYVLGTSYGFKILQHGLASDRPVAADYDGDGKADLAVFRPSEGNWYIRRSGTSSELGEMQVMALGSSSDITLPGQ